MVEYLGMETYRSGHNELDSKSSCRATGTWVRIPPSPLFEKACKTAANVDFTGFFDVFHMVKNAEIS